MRDVLPGLTLLLVAACGGPGARSNTSGLSSTVAGTTASRASSAGAATTGGTGGKGASNGTGKTSGTGLSSVATSAGGASRTTGSVGAGTSNGTAGGASSAGVGASSGGGASTGTTGSGGPPLFGDRNEGVSVAYPDGALVQNGGRVIDVKNPPSSLPIAAAAGDGTTDDTQALISVYDVLKNAFVQSGRTGQPYWVYFPSGTYLVSDTLIYSGGSIVVDPQTDNDLMGVRLIGESRETTTIKLMDGAPGFQDKANPKILVAFQHPDTVFNNIPAMNVLENLTVDVGSGNPGAVGVQFQGANVTGMRNVRVTSDDGAGMYGIWFRMGSVQGNYRDVTVEGFDTGLITVVSAEMSPSFEHVTLTGQNVAGATVLAGSLSLRAAEIDERATSATAVLVDQSGGQAVIVDSELLGGAAANGLELTSTAGQFMFARNVQATGFGNAVVQAGNPVVAADAAGLIGEWVSATPVALFPSQPTRSFTLPAVDTPLVPWFDPAVDWANVQDYGAIGDGTTDDTAAVQAALDSGKSVVYFPSAAYNVSSLDIRATVQRVEGMYAVMQPLWNVSEPSAQPVLLRGIQGFGGITVSAVRDVVLELWSGEFVNQAQGAATLFLENGANIGFGDGFDPAGQRVFARSLNDEEGTGSGDIRVNGGTLWLFNYKTENKPVSTLSALNGAIVQSLGGYTNLPASPQSTPLLLNQDSNVVFVGTTNLFCTAVQTAIEETRNGQTVDLAPASLPSRGSGNDGCYTIPLYVGYDPAAVQ